MPSYQTSVGDTVELLYLLPTQLFQIPNASQGASAEGPKSDVIYVF